jgi:hypothetical protein
MKALSDIAPWSTQWLDADPPAGFWAFNPSVIRTPDADGGRWLCSIRCANYHLPGSATAPEVQPSPLCNRNLLAELDAKTLRPIRIVEMIDRDARERGGHRYAPSFNYEDLRLVHTTHDGLCAIGNSLMLNEGGTLEIVRLALDDDYQIVHVDPLRGSAWSSKHQKNWQPYQHTDTLRFLYSVTEGGVHDQFGRIIPTHAPKFFDNAAVPISPDPQVRAAPPQQRQHGSMQVQIGPARHKTAAPRQAAFALRGGSQLVHVDQMRWLGLAHGAVVGGGIKYYWHRWIAVDGEGALRSVSEPFKLDPRVGIEFAAGLALDPTSGRLVVSYGIEDDTAHLGTTDLESVFATLLPLEDAMAREARAQTTKRSRA